MMSLEHAKLFSTLSSLAPVEPGRATLAGTPWPRLGPTWQLAETRRPVVRLGGGHSALHPGNWPAPRAGATPRSARSPGRGGSTGVEEGAGADANVAA